MVLDEGWLGVAAEIRSCEDSHNEVLYEGWILERYILMSCMACNVAQQTRVIGSVAGWLFGQSVGCLTKITSAYSLTQFLNAEYVAPKRRR
jgi:hypothetical protein